MTLSDVELPSNRKFGFFFAAVFLAASIYFHLEGKGAAVIVFGLLSALFLLITLIRADLLLPLNKLWMRIGLLLGMVVSPLVLGVLFFALFTPIAFVMRWRGRDELGLRFAKQTTHWKKRDAAAQSDSFKHQF